MFLGMIMRAVRLLAAFAVLVTILSGCATEMRIKQLPKYEGPEITKISVFKSSRRMYLWHNDEVVRAFAIDLGFAPVGDKKIAGDGKTPEGRYYIDRRNPTSDFHLSLGISYPNARDIAEAAAMGKSPGGDIFIHGAPSGLLAVKRDWTWGCIAVTNPEMEEIYMMVKTGTPITIHK